MQLHIKTINLQPLRSKRTQDGSDRETSQGDENEEDEPPRTSIKRESAQGTILYSLTTISGRYHKRRLLGNTRGSFS